MASTKKEQSSLWKVTNVVLGMFFSLACFVNRNDADWYLWMPIYSIPCLLCFSAALKPSLADGPFWQAVATLLLYGCLVYACYEVFALSMVFTTRGIINPFAVEEGRELGGLIIIVTWARTVLSSLAAKGCSESSEQSSMTSMVWVMASLAVIPLAFWSLCFIPGLGTSLGHCVGMKSC
ncbi:hypothetical protein EGW08_016754 [Elysia chlorotica]|uniref:Transmembrane protein 220 n=1 Tax=Elysia chlorotica TaxID=188477 RepID=A0A433T1P7_ELYCH|nr:hypothetical protein EGW08_016754 [Elysia chlorotica]